MLAPPASRIASMFCSTRVVWPFTSPVNTKSPLAGSTEPCPDTCRMLPLRTPCENTGIGGGASVVETAVLSDIRSDTSQLWSVVVGTDRVHGGEQLREQL